MTEALLKTKPLILITIIALVIVAAFIFVSPTVLSAQTARDAACQGVELTGGSCDSAASEATVNKTLGTIINIFSVIVGFAAVVMVIIGGLRYITSNGDSNSVNGAKNTILYAIIGLVVVALAQVIVQFVLNRI